jgi:hypothetical protein
MILRIDRAQTEMPPPSDPDPTGAARVQELMGGRFGEMSTFMNYTAAGGLCARLRARGDQRDRPEAAQEGGSARRAARRGRQQPQRQLSEEAVHEKAEVEGLSTPNECGVASRRGR